MTDAKGRTPAAIGAEFLLSPLVVVDELSHPDALADWRLRCRPTSTWTTNAHIFV